MMHHTGDQLGPKTTEPRSSGSLLMVRHSSTRLSLNKEPRDLETTYYKDVEPGYIVTFRQRYLPTGLDTLTGLFSPSRTNFRSRNIRHPGFQHVETTTAFRRGLYRQRRRRQ